jgi:tetratricopeptide (TPR) repeat protein
MTLDTQAAVQQFRDQHRGYSGSLPSFTAVVLMRAHLYHEARLLRFEGRYDEAAQALARAKQVAYFPEADEYRLPFAEPLEAARIAIAQGNYQTALGHLDVAAHNAGSLEVPGDPNLSQREIAPARRAEVELLKGLALLGLEEQHEARVKKRMAEAAERRLEAGAEKELAEGIEGEGEREMAEGIESGLEKETAGAMEEDHPRGTGVPPAELGNVGAPPAEPSAVAAPRVEETGSAGVPPAAFPPLPLGERTGHSQIPPLPFRERAGVRADPSPRAAEARRIIARALGVPVKLSARLPESQRRRFLSGFHTWNALTAPPRRAESQAANEEQPP